MIYCALYDCDKEIMEDEDNVAVSPYEIYHRECAGKQIRYLRNGLESLAKDAKSMAEN